MNTRDQLAMLGEAAMCRNGYGGFSYADLAKAAGIRKASIHHHFPAKADLGIAVLDKYADRLATALDDIKATSRTGAQALQACIALYRAALDSGEAMCLCSALAADQSILTEPMQMMLQRANAMVIGWLESVLLMGRQDRSIVVPGVPADDAVAILAQLQGAQLIARASKDVALFDVAVSSINARMLRQY
jgi:TetR/AcrR family transcriptional repressor of nem operon